MNKQMQSYKVTNGEQTTYYYYIEKNVYVTKRAYYHALIIILGTIWISYNVSWWYFFGVELSSFLDFFDAFLVFAWLFIIKGSFQILPMFANKVQVLQKVVIEDKDGNKIENWCN